MKLTVQERFSLMEILPTQSNFLELRIIAELRDELALSDDEGERVSLRPMGDHRMAWNAEAAEAVIKDCTIGKHAYPIIVTVLKQLDKTKKLERAHLSLYEKFILAKEQETPDG